MKKDKLEKLKEEMLSDKDLPLKTNLVFGEGNINSEILFIGEAPGAEEDKLIRPFVGRSGQLLRKMIRENGFKEDDVYITNIVKRRPPENRDPSPYEIEKYRPYLKKQIEIINPKIIVPLGRFSMNYFLPEGKISRDQGKLFFAKESGFHVAPMFHPAAILRGTFPLKVFEEGFKNLPSMIKKIEQIKKSKNITKYLSKDKLLPKKADQDKLF